MPRGRLLPRRPRQVWCGRFGKACGHRLRRRGDRGKGGNDQELPPPDLLPNRAPPRIRMPMM